MYLTDACIPAIPKNPENPLAITDLLNYLGISRTKTPWAFDNKI